MSNIDDGGPELSPARVNEGVGYRNPPTYRRFKESGNPRGRPKGAKNRKTIVKTVASEMQTVFEDGERRRRSTLELVLLRLRNMALKDKNVRAFNEHHRLLKTYEPQAESQNAGYAVMPAEISKEEWIAEMERKNALMTKYGVRNLGALAEKLRLEN